MDFSGASEDLAERRDAWPESLGDVARRGAALLALIRALPEPAAHVAVVSHGVFLETLLAGGDDCAAPLACDERHRAARWCEGGGGGGFGRLCSAGGAACTISLYALLPFYLSSLLPNLPLLAG